MKDELNNYNINNPDGASKQKFDIKIDNETPGFIKENSLEKQEAVFRPLEQEDIGSDNTSVNNESVNTSKTENVQSDIDLSSTAQSATSSMSSVASTAGSSLGAVAGALTSSVAATVMVVAAFVSTLTIKLTLILATMTSLVFNLQMEGVQEEDFLTPIVAILTAQDGTYMEQEIGPETVYLTFEDLTPGTEYTIVVRNEEKIFDTKTYFTSSEEVSKGTINASHDGNEYSVYVSEVVLKRGEYYTVTVKDAKGNVVFTKDDILTEAEYHFTVDEPKSLFFQLAISGVSYSATAIEIIPGNPEPNYDLANGVWNWSNDNATLTFNDLNGGAPLILQAAIIKETINPTCDEDGYVKANATVEYQGQKYFDEKIYVNEGSAIGHALELHEAVEPTCVEAGSIEYYVCSVCGKYFDVEKNEITEDALIVPAHGHVKGELIEYKPSTCTEHGMEDHYECIICGQLFHISGTPVSAEDITFNLSDHAYGSLQEAVEPTCEKEGHYAYYQCENCEKYFTVDYEPTTWEDLVIAKIDHDIQFVPESPATCDSNGLLAHYQCTVCNKIFEDLEGTTVLSEEDIIMPARHVTGELYEALEPTCEDAGHVAYYRCENCGEYFTASMEKVSREDLIIAALGHDMVEVPASSELKEHYECTRCDGLFVLGSDGYQRVSIEDLMKASGAEVSITSNPLCINPHGYSTSETGLNNPTPFESSVGSPYIIENQNNSGCDNIIQVYQTDTSIQTADIYIKLKDVNIQAGSWCSLFLIVATNNLNIHLLIEGSVTFTGGSGQQVFSSQRTGSPTVTIYIDQTTYGGTFNVNSSSGVTYAQTGSINIVYV